MQPIPSGHDAASGPMVRLHLMSCFVTITQAFTGAVYGIEKRRPMEQPRDLPASGGTHCYRAFGWELCEFEPANCDRCGKVDSLYFGDVDYYDSREGTYLCEECLKHRLREEL